MDQFIQQYEKKVIGVLNGFDRLVLRGNLRMLSFTAGMMEFLSVMGVLLKDFGEYVEKTTMRLKEASYEAAKRLDRPIIYLPSSNTRKEKIAHKTMQTDGIKKGLICILTCVEPCISYKVVPDRKLKKLVLVSKERRCLHIYHYWVDPIHVWLNGREFLARQMDRLDMNYERRENCFVRLRDTEKAQKLMDKLLRIQWPSVLDKIANQLNPAHKEIFGKYRASYYWTIHQSEWATDVMFTSPKALASIYTALVRGGISTFSSNDVMRFLGRKLHGNFAKEVVSDYKKRPEGIRIKHRMGANALKLYDKQGSNLRVETTINDPSDFKVFRPKQGEPDGVYKWRPMRKNIADIYRRSQVSQASNERYLDALSSLNTDKSLCEIVDPVCRPIIWKDKRVRALHPWSEEDQNLLQAISRGEFNVNGFRNRDIVRLLSPSSLSTVEEKKRAAARITRKFRILRAHRIIRKVNHTHRYVLALKGKNIISAVFMFQQVSLEQLNRAVA
jgi:hypothetical protein